MISPRPSAPRPTAATRQCGTSRRQASAAAAAARDAAEAHGQASERARLAHSRVAAFERRLATSAEAKLAALRVERGGVESALADATGGQEGANRRLVALSSSRERLGMRQESAATLAETLARELAEAQAIARRGGLSPAELERQRERRRRSGASSGDGA